jgi:hypothetical protein
MGGAVDVEVGRHQSIQMLFVMSIFDHYLAIRSYQNIYIIIPGWVSATGLSPEVPFLLALVVAQIGPEHLLFWDPEIEVALNRNGARMCMSMPR